MSQSFLSKVLVCACLALPALAQRAKVEKVSEPEHMQMRKSTPGTTAAKPSAASLSYSTWEVYKFFNIGPGQAVNLDSGIDFYASDLVSVTIRAASGSVDLTDLEVLAYWSFPDADYWSVAETSHGLDFPFTNVGGAVFNVYGSQFRLRLVNNGTSTLSLAQVTIRCRSL